MNLTRVVGCALIALTVAGVSQPALASMSQCTGSKTCIWADNDFEGAFADRTQGQANWERVPSRVNNDMDSWMNKSSRHDSCGADKADGMGDKQLWRRVSNDDNVSPVNSDEVSSWKTTGGCS